jgi:hypothetical protein
LAKIKETPTGDTYFVFPIPGEGLHVSFHASGEVHLRGRKDPLTGRYEIDEPVDIDIPWLEEDPESAVEELLDDILVEPPADEEYLTFPASKIAFLGCISDLPKKEITMDIPRLLSDILSSVDIFSFCDLARYPDRGEDESVLLAMGLDSQKMIIPLPADSFDRSLAISADRLIGREGRSNFHRRFIAPLMGALEKGYRLAKPENIDRWVPRINSGEIMEEFNTLLDKPEVRRNIDGLAERMRQRMSQEGVDEA